MAHLTVADWPGPVACVQLRLSAVLPVPPWGLVVLTMSAHLRISKHLLPISVSLGTSMNSGRSRTCVVGGHQYVPLGQA